MSPAQHRQPTTFERHPMTTEYGVDIDAEPGMKTVDVGARLVGQRYVGRQRATNPPRSEFLVLLVAVWIYLVLTAIGFLIVAQAIGVLR